MIIMSGISKRYQNGQLALQDISIHIKKGEFVFIVGPSGAGKSTFVKMLFREETPSSGTLFVNGVNVGSMPESDVPFLRRSLGIVFQDYRLLPDRTVHDNIAFAMQVIDAPYRTIQKRVNTVLDMVGLRHKSRAYPQEMAGGEQQRVAIARAIVNEPYLVIADEPTGSLDPENSLEIMRILNEINRDGTTVVMATHDKEVVNAMNKRVIAIENGVIARDDVEGVYGYES